MKKILSVSVLLAISFLLKAQQSNPYPKTISVTGSAEMEVVPDEIYVQVELEEYKKKGDKIELETIKTNFLAACKTIGIPDSLISIAAYQGSNDYWRRKKKDPDMLSTISYQVKFKDPKKIDELVDHLDDEATKNFRVVKTSHSKMQEFRRQLKIQAIKAAKDKAIYMSQAIGENIGEAITIMEQNENNWPYNYANIASNNTLLRDQEAIPDNGSVNFRKIKLRFEVSVAFALK